MTKLCDRWRTALDRVRWRFNPQPLNRAWRTYAAEDLWGDISLHTVDQTLGKERPKQRCTTLDDYRIDCFLFAEICQQRSKIDTIVFGGLHRLTHRRNEHLAARLFKRFDALLRSLRRYRDQRGGLVRCLHELRSKRGAAPKNQPPRARGSSFLC